MSEAKWELLAAITLSCAIFFFMFGGVSFWSDLSEPSLVHSFSPQVVAHPRPSFSRPALGETWLQDVNGGLVSFASKIVDSVRSWSRPTAVSPPEFGHAATEPLGLSPDGEKEVLEFADELKSIIGKAMSEYPAPSKDRLAEAQTDSPNIRFHRPLNEVAFSRYADLQSRMKSGGCHRHGRQQALRRAMQLRGHFLGAIHNDRSEHGRLVVVVNGHPLGLEWLVDADSQMDSRPMSSSALFVFKGFHGNGLQFEQRDVQVKSQEYERKDVQGKSEKYEREDVQGKSSW